MSTMTDEKQAQKIRALLAERESAIARRRIDLVAQIDDQLRRYGHEGVVAVKRASRRQRG